jgi:hypothetical protein
MITKITNNSGMPTPPIINAPCTGNQKAIS